MKNIIQMLGSKINNRDGVVTYIVVLGLVAIVLAGALVVDYGMAVIEDVKLSNALDAAVLGGSLELPTDPVSARTVAEGILTDNGVALDHVIITIGTGNMSMEINGNKDVQFALAKIIGLNSGIVNAKSKAIIGPMGGTGTGVRPFGVEQQELIYGQQVILKEEGGDGTTGNYGALALGNTGSSTFTYNTLYGFDGDISIGDILDSEPGNMASVIDPLKTYLNTEPVSVGNISRESIRLWTIPIMDDMNMSGRDTATVVGFAKFYIEDIKERSGKAEITGRFIRYTSSGEIDENAQDWGSYSNKLVN